MKRNICFSVLFLLFLSACRLITVVMPTEIPVIPVQSPTPVISLPDLVLSNVYLGMQGVSGGSSDCVAQYAPFEIRITVQNLGDAPAYNISVNEAATGANLTIGELGAGQSIELYFPATSPIGTYNFLVDSQNMIPESSENNNMFSYLAPTPTPPALCPASGTPVPDVSTPVPTSVPGNTPLSETTLRNAVYRSQDFGEFQMLDGIYYRTPPTSQESPEVYTTRIHGTIFYGDINSDGFEDALVILNTQNGGTGHFIELAAVINQNGIPENVSTLSLGDRVVVESASVENGTIVLNMRVHGPNDGLCCPSQPALWSFILDENQLVKLP